MFAALLLVLARRFPCYVIVRNPLSILASGRFGESCLPVDSGGAGLGLSYGAADL
jgi:hypothetical protein